MKLTKDQQRALLIALPASRKHAIKKHCHDCQMRGAGMSEILTSVTAYLGPIAKKVGPVVLKDFILPYVLQKIEKRLESFIEKQSGEGLRLAGQRGRGRRRKRVLKKN